MFFWDFNLFFSLLACTETRLQQSMKLADKNRDELEMVIAHYSKKPEDSLNLKSAIFLIENMQHHFTLESNWIDEYYKSVDSVKNLKIGPIATRNRIHHIFDSIPFSIYQVHQRNDLQTLKADYLIRNIDFAVDEWQNGFWAKHIVFEEFCEYILPYRFGTDV